MAVVQNAELDAYLNRDPAETGEIGVRAHADPERRARRAVSLQHSRGRTTRTSMPSRCPGGPIYINTGSIVAADNEAQLAGVIAHEMSHVVLRHSTNQVSKRNLVELPALLAEAVTGDSLMGQLAQLGIGLGANSALLKFSRTDEAQADYNGTEIMADAGYNPIETGAILREAGGERRARRGAGTVSVGPSESGQPDRRDQR